MANEMALKEAFDNDQKDLPGTVNSSYTGKIILFISTVRKVWWLFMKFEIIIVYF